MVSLPTRGEHSKHEAMKYKATYLLIKSSVLSVTNLNEPQEPDYGDCEMDASDYEHLTGSILYKQRMDEWTVAMKAFNESFIKVDRYEAFLDQILPKEAINWIPSGLAIDSLNDGLYPAPEGIEFEVKTPNWIHPEEKVAVVSLVDAKEKEQSGEPGNEAKKDEAPLKPKWIESLELKVRLSKSAGLKQVSLDYDEIDRLLKIANPD